MSPAIRSGPRCAIICRKCGGEKPAEEFRAGKPTCRACSAVSSRRHRRTQVARERKQTAEPRPFEDDDQTVEFPRERPREDAPSVAVYLRAETFHHARCHRPLLVIGYRPSSEEIHFRCQPCSENVFLPTAAVERLVTR